MPLRNLDAHSTKNVTAAVSSGHDFRLLFAKPPGWRGSLCFCRGPPLHILYLSNNIFSPQHNVLSFGQMLSIPTLECGLPYSALLVYFASTPENMWAQHLFVVLEIRGRTPRTPHTLLSGPVFLGDFRANSLDFVPSIPEVSVWNRHA